MKNLTLMCHLSKTQYLSMLVVSLHFSSSPETNYASIFILSYPTPAYHSNNARRKKELLEVNRSNF